MTDHARMAQLLKLRSMRADKSRRLLNDAISEEKDTTLAADAATQRHATAETKAAHYTAERFARADLSQGAAEFMSTLAYNIRSLRREAKSIRIEAAVKRHRQHIAARSRKEIAERYRTDQARQDQIAQTVEELLRKFRNLHEDAEEQSIQDVCTTGNKNGLR